MSIDQIPIEKMMWFLSYFSFFLPSSECFGWNLRDAEIQKAENIFFPLPLFFYLETKLVSNMQLDWERKRESETGYILCTANRITETPNGKYEAKKVAFVCWLEVFEIRTKKHYLSFSLTLTHTLTLTQTQHT